MNISIVSTRCILLFLMVVLTGIQSRSLKKRASGTAYQCAPEDVFITVAVPTCHERNDIPVKQCQGTCPSYTIPSSSGPGVVQVCDCCRILEEEIVTVELKCRGTNGQSAVRLHDIISAKTCSCLPCI